MLNAHIESLADEDGYVDPESPLFPNTMYEHAEHDMTQAMEELGVDPAIIYAFQETGLMVSDENQHLISDADLAKWHAALERYRTLHPPATEGPVGVVAHYGPDDRKTTKIVASVFLHPGAEPIMEKFVSTKVSEDPAVRAKIRAFFESHGVTNVVATDGNIGCTHEEGEDFPNGEDCPFCPYWKGKQGSAATQELPTNDAASDNPMEGIMERMSSMFGEDGMAELEQLAEECGDADEFANLLLVGECPQCSGQSTTDCEEDPELQDPTIGHCNDCDFRWCLDCGDPFSSKSDAAAHDCEVWNEFEDGID